MNVVFDHGTPPRLAATLDGHLSPSGGRAVHVGDLPCGRHPSDIAWIEHLRGTGLAWTLVTGDLRLQRVPIRRFAFRQAGLGGILLAGAFQALEVDAQASLLLRRWPDVEALVGPAAPPFLFELPGGRSSPLRALSL
ncbi:hypothetical protein D3273_17630 [Lichenibacterium minor]|uniref:VapC45 PIN like domain-containing protein n=1 Tax=Lichenibacterium minor TaxID=2316528 RepID=A0A4Q2U4E5_9HYPH|nr:hypothetical protein [Lichenibacterium minor]RYC30668.1 hypothetical protein D3273_17630 [Lichenibacterium minor]